MLMFDVEVGVLRPPFTPLGLTRDYHLISYSSLSHGRVKPASLTCSHVAREFAGTESLGPTETPAPG